MRIAPASSAVLTIVFAASTTVAGQHGHAPTPHMAPTPHPTGSHTTSHSTPHSPTSHPTASHPPNSHTSHSTSRSSTTTSGRTTTTTATSPIAAKIQSHPQLASKLTPLLPKGMTLDRAASGFRNQGQFIAALHVSHNLGIPFVDLKQQMVMNHNSLGQSIQVLRPSSDGPAEAERAETQADHDVTTTSTSTSTTRRTNHGGQ